MRRSVPAWLSRRRLLLGLLVLGGVGALAVLVLSALPSILVGPDEDLSTAERLKAENDVRTTLLQALAGIALLTGAYFTGRTYILNRESTNRQFALDRQGQVTERFTKAIDQLGSESLDVRLGGIYAPERIAQESERDHWPIVEVLTAFVRERARWIAPDNGETKPEAEQLSGPDADVQAVLTVLGRRNRDHEREDQYLQLAFTDLRRSNLRRAHLEGASLQRAHLEAASLEEAHLEGADLLHAYLEGADLSKAHLEDADLGEARLEHARLREARLERASLFGARLEHALLSKAHLEGTNLVEAHLEGAYLQEAHLEGADLSDARLEDAHLSQAHLEEAVLHEAHLGGAWLDVAHLERARLTRAGLRNANLRAAHLEGADLREADLEGATLYSAYLDGADLRGANLEGAKVLTPAQMRGAQTDELTKLPPGLRPNSDQNASPD
jgi:uncharacterized protein YjbI with pentapeptide repeats